MSECGALVDAIIIYNEYSHSFIRLGKKINFGPDQTVNINTQTNLDSRGFNEILVHVAQLL